MREFREELKRRIAATREPDAPRHSGKWCKWCNAKVDCKTYRELVQRETAADFAGIDAPAVVKNMVSPDDMTPEMMARALSVQDIITEWFDAIADRVKARLERGEEVPGWKLVDGRSNRQWVSEAVVIEEFEGLMGDTLFKPKTLRSPADLEKTIGIARVAELTFKPTPKKTIAPADDYRKESKETTTSADFKHLEQQFPVSQADRVKTPEEEALGDLL